MYGGRHYFNYINTNKNLVITVLIPENASLLDGCRGPYYFLFFSFLCLPPLFLSFPFFVLQPLLWTIDTAAPMWDLRTGVIFCFLPLPCLGKAQLSYSIPYSTLKFVVGGKSLWASTFEYQMHCGLWVSTFGCVLWKLRTYWSVLYKIKDLFTFTLVEVFCKKFQGALAYTFWV